MSNESLPSSVDTDRPYLIPRRDGNIEVWHIATNDVGEPRVDNDGLIMLKGQHPEMINGKMGIPAKGAHIDALGDEVQGYLADQLGRSRESITPEQLIRSAKVQSDISEAALASIGIDAPIDTEHPAVDSETLRHELAEQIHSHVHHLINITDKFAGAIESRATELDNRHERQKLLNLINDELIHLQATGNETSYQIIDSKLDYLRDITLNIAGAKEYMPTANGAIQTAHNIRTMLGELDEGAEKYFAATTNATNDHEFVHVVEEATRLHQDIARFLESDAQPALNMLDTADDVLESSRIELTNSVMYRSREASSMRVKIEHMMEAATKSDMSRSELTGAYEQLTSFVNQLRRLNAQIEDTFSS